ncbi:MAG TPA: hypothetical protein VK550_08890 [Polyangiaceae bacterium]|nr:hypothetical protein [Polyangiaceae bacterium]
MKISLGVVICLAIPNACTSGDGGSGQAGGDACRDVCVDAPNGTWDAHDPPDPGDGPGTSDPQDAHGGADVYPDRVDETKDAVSEPSADVSRDATARPDTIVPPLADVSVDTGEARDAWDARGDEPLETGTNTRDAGCTGDGSIPPPGGKTGPRLVAYVNTLCGFGIGPDNGTCLDTPDSNQNHILAWECAGKSPITHYVLSFLSFKGAEIQTDPGPIWANGGGSTTDFVLHANLRDAMLAARAAGAKIMLSLGGEVGSSGFLSWWTAQGGTSAARVTMMRSRLETLARAFASQNGVPPDGIDVDIELGGAYAYGSDKYVATRDLINAVPEDLLVAFVPQVGNGLCAAPVVGDPLSPTIAMGGQCTQPVNGDDSPWSLARLDKDCLRGDGTPRLDYFGIQYYNAGTAECCGGGGDPTAMVRSTAQNYKNLANGWPASGDLADTNNPWHAYQWYPGPWAAFAGTGAQRLVLGKPGCQGCAGSNYLDLTAMKDLLGSLDGRLTAPMGGILFWDLSRLFSKGGPLCVSGTCQPSWASGNPLQNLTDLVAQMRALRPAVPR